jgi:hypothetical protein
MANGKGTKSSKQDVAVAKKEVVEPLPPENPDTHCCFQGEQPFFSSSDEAVCHAIANKRKADLTHQGVDIRDKEHAVEVREL